MPMVGHLAENGLIIGDEFRDGNESPSPHNLEFIKDCASKMPKGTRIANVAKRRLLMGDPFSQAS